VKKGALTVARTLGVQSGIAEKQLDIFFYALKL